MLVKLVLGTALLGGSALLLPQAAPDQEKPGKYNVDAVHSSILYRIHHLGAGYFWGRFNQVSGSLQVDHENPAHTRIEIKIPAASIDSNNKDRDEHLKGPDFFDVKQFPELVFQSTSVKVAKPGVLDVTGDLSLHGVKKSITFQAVHTGHGLVMERAGYRSGYEAEFTIRRADFGMNYMADALGAEVKVIVALECTPG